MQITLTVAGSNETVTGNISVTWGTGLTLVTGPMPWDRRFFRYSEIAEVNFMNFKPINFF